MEKIERQINKLIKEIEKCANEFEKLKNEYNVTYVRENDFKEGDLKLKLTSIVEAPNFENEGEILKFEYSEILDTNVNFIHSYTAKTTQLLFNTFKELKEQAKFLINLLDKNKQKDFIKRVDAIEIEKIQAKKYITVKEFAEIYNMSKTKQQTRRARLHDPLPYKQEVENGKIFYEVEEVEKWLKNQYK